MSTLDSFKILTENKVSQNDFSTNLASDLRIFFPFLSLFPFFPSVQKRHKISPDHCNVVFINDREPTANV